ncbi:MAG: aminopeptidase P family protein [Candidatus Korarchaeota archaeon]|nr:aminopeptidase P family protein [Candidatus Korarchaeota archaeon]
MYPREELEGRIKRLRRWMSRRDIDLSLLKCPSNMLYLSGSKEARLLAVPLDDEPFLVARYAFGDEIVREQTPFHVEVIKPHYGVSSKEVYDPKPLDPVAERHGDAKRIAVDFTSEEDNIKYLRKKFRRGKKGAAILDVTPQLVRMRSVKSEYEISLIRESAEIAMGAFEQLEIEVGMTEREIANRLDFNMRELGAEGTSFPTIIAIGSHSFNAHHVVTDRRLSEDDILLMDFGAVYKGYCSDMTRTFYIGKPPSKFIERYEVVLKAQSRALGYIKDGLAIEKPDIEARKVIKEAGLLDHYVHGLGHGIGLDVHEYPSLRVGKPGHLEQNMVVSDEPGVYIRGWGGIRIEDTVVVGKSGGISLTNKISKDPLALRR